MKALLGILSALVLATVVANAQTSSTTTTSTDGATTSTTTTETTGTITDFTPGTSIVLNTGAAPVTYKFGKTVTYVTTDGKVIEASKVKKNSKVRVHYVKEGSETIVDKVIVLDND